MPRLYYFDFCVHQVIANEETLRGYGDVVNTESEILEKMRNSRWPKVDGWRPLSEGTGDEQVRIPFKSKGTKS